MGAGKRTGKPSSQPKNSISSKAASPTAAENTAEAVPVGIGRRANHSLNVQLTKTRLCMYNAKGSCQYGAACTFAHSVGELQATPDLHRTRMCKAFLAGSCCDDACTYAHGEAQLRSTDLFFKKSLCIWHEKGKCRNGAQCRFAHGYAEMRQLQEPVSQEAEMRHPKRQPDGYVEQLWQPHGYVPAVPARGGGGAAVGAGRGARAAGRGGGGPSSDRGGEPMKVLPAMGITGEMTWAADRVDRLDVARCWQGALEPPQAVMKVEEPSELKAPAAFGAHAVSQDVEALQAEIAGLSLQLLWMQQQVMAELPPPPARAVAA